MQAQEAAIQGASAIYKLASHGGALVIGIALSSCSGPSPAEKAELDWKPKVTWAKLQDGSFGWSEDDAMGFHAERCWKHADGFRCIQLLRSDPDDGVSIDIDDGRVTFYGRRTKTLEKHKVYPESGYSCELLSDMPSYGLRRADAEESITLGSGATVTNEIFSFDENAWSERFVKDFVISNSPPGSEVVHFDCLALVSFFERANDQAFVTNALKERDVFHR